jgi:hypothetical protein
MAERSPLCSEPDDFATASTAGAALPFLPTLAFAAILGLCAVCWESASPVSDTPGESAQASTASTPMPRMARAQAEEASSITAPAPAVEASHRPPAAIAFALQFPLSAEAIAVAKAPAARPHHRIARTAPSCAGPRCAEPAQTASTALRRPHPPAAAPPFTPSDDPFASSRQAERSEAAIADGTPPEQALPFAPAIRAVRHTVGQTVGILGVQAAMLRGEAVALGGVVTDLVDGLR